VRITKDKEKEEEEEEEEEFMCHVTKQ